MRPTLELLPVDTDTSFRCQEFAAHGLVCALHTHPELEILQVVRGSGEWMVGDYIGSMRPGQIFLLGPDLPHGLNMPRLPRRSGLPADCIRVIQFRHDCMGAALFEIPEMRSVLRLLERSIRGLHLVASAPIDRLMKSLLQESPHRRPALFLMLLDVLAAAPVTPLASPGYMAAFRPGHSERLDRAHRIVLEQFGDPKFNQQEAARRLAMSPAALSRFFKRRTGKDFSRFLSEVRIGQACRMLEETDDSILTISLACGFANLSNFNRRFRQSKGVTPRTYRSRRTPENLTR